MQSIKTLLVFAVFSMLVACGDGAAVDGRFEVTQSVMGQRIGKQQALLSSGEVFLNGQTFKIDKWKKEGDIFSALDKAGNSVLTLKQVDSDTFEVQGLPSSAKMTFRRI
ncbi:hypothetical protein [Pseudomonas sp.]|uniref:hypothetical protein n=1 Tax=Pseudomonas sp. TaxID=306 RepID=UPI0028AC5468|nr:hypothetical protein [Pseudomonas sp.]